MRSKLTLHVNRASDAVIDFVARAQPRALVILCIEDTAFVRAVKAASPLTRLMGRHFDNDAPVERPEWVADKFWEAITSKAAYQERLIDDWFGPNEIDTTQGENVYGLCKIDEMLGTRFRQAGRRYWMFSTAERQPPDVDNWNWTRDPRFRRAAEAAYGYAVHAYWWPRLGDRGDQLRHQRWYAQLPADLRKPLVIKECGPDAGVIGQHHKGWWTAYGGDARLAMADLAKWDELLRADHAVEAAAIFCADPAGWDDFNVLRSSELMGLLTEHIRTSWEVEAVIPEWIEDIRDEVAFDTGRKRGAMRGICVHHEGTRADEEDALEFYKRCREVNYHWFLGKKIYYLNDIHDVVWHAGDRANGPWNSGGVAVCFTGDLRGQGKPTATQFANFRKLRAWLLTQGVGTEIVCHKAVRVPPYSTECPGDWWPDGVEAHEIGALWGDYPLEDELAKLRQDNAMLRGKVRYAEVMAEKLLDYMRGG